MASEDVTRILEKAGIAFADIPVYRTELIEYPAGEEDFDIITFTSRSCVEGYVGSLTGEEKASAEGAKALCIGEKTAEAAKKYGFDVVVSHEATIESMLEKATEI